MSSKAGRDAIYDLLLLCLIGTKEPVPYDQDTAEILINIYIIRAVMYAMIGWGIKYILDIPEPAYSLCMKEKLIEEIERVGADDIEWRYADQHQRYIEYRTDQKAEPVEPVCYAEVHMLAAVVYEVKGPEKFDHMRDAVKPIVAEIYCDYSDQKKR